MTFDSLVFLTCRRVLTSFFFFNCDLSFRTLKSSRVIYRVFSGKIEEKMSNFPLNDGHVNQTEPYAPNSGSTEPGPFNNRYGAPAPAPAPGQYQQPPRDPRQQEMQEFIVGIFIPKQNHF